MTIKAQTVIMSHLSDLGFEVNQRHTEQIMGVRVSFIKWLILNLNGDLNQEIDPDEKFYEFEKLREETIKSIQQN